MAESSDRGRVVDVEFDEEIKFNGGTFWRAQIEIDHINHGLNKEKTGLNKKARSHFTEHDVVKFLKTLDGEFIKEIWRNKKKTISRFVVKVDCPIKGPSYQKIFRMVFETKKSSSGRFFVVTLFEE